MKIYPKGKIIFNFFISHDAVVLLGTSGANQTEKPVRVVGYKIAGVKYFVITDRYDRTAEQVTTVYKLRWEIDAYGKIFTHFHA